MANLHQHVVPRLLLLALTLAWSGGVATAQNSSTPRSSHPKPPVKENRAGSALARAETALEQKDYATAESLLKEMVADDSSDPRAWYDLGFVYSSTGRKAEAISAYRKSVNLDPKLFESTLNLGLLLAQARDPEAEKYLRTATTLTPPANPDEGHARAWLALGRLLEENDAAGALAAFKEVAKLQPKDPEPHLFSAALLQRLDKREEAEKELLQAAQLDPKSADAALGLADIYQKSDRLPEAEKALRKYVDLQPQDATACFQLGRILLAQHKRYDAIAAYEAGLKLRPDEVTAQVELGFLYDLAGKFAPAETLLREAVAKRPDLADAHAGLGTVRLHQHRPTEAIPELLQAIKLDPKMAEAYNSLALAASANKDYVLAIRALDARAKLLPENAVTYFLRATSYDKLNDPQHAVENYRLFLQADEGRIPNQEWQAKHRIIALEPKK